MSAKSIEARTALCSEARTKVQNVSAKILKYKTIKDRIALTLKVSLAAYINHKSRQYCVILDLSFRLCINGKYLSLVNGTTVKKSPQESMGQIGSTLKRLVLVMADNYNLDLPFLFTKLKIAYGFWRLVVSHLQAWNFCYVLPATDGRQVSLGETEPVVPMAPQTVWCKSPPLFCAGSETAWDIISYLVKGNTTLPCHKFEKFMIPNYLHSNMPEKLADIIEVFVYEFIGSINNADITHLLHFSHCMLHGIHTNPPTPL